VDKEAGRRVRGKEKELFEQLKNRDVTAAAPQSILPKGKFTSKGEAVEALQEIIVLAIDFLGLHEGYTNHTTFHPQFGELSAYQWMLMIPAHGNRHIDQMLAVKASGGYPTP
jgi:hypothetical protein